MASISDAGPVSPFRIVVNDVDLGDTFSVTITETGTVRGALSATTLTGTAEVAWIYRQVMTDLGVHLCDENPILAMGRALALIVEPT